MGLAVATKLGGSSRLLDPHFKIPEHTAYTKAEMDPTTMKALLDDLCMCMLVGSQWLVGVAMWWLCNAWDAYGLSSTKRRAAEFGVCKDASLVPHVKHPHTIE